MSFLTINKFKTSKSSSKFLEVHIFALYTFLCNKLVVQPGFHYNKCILKKKLGWNVFRYFSLTGIVAPFGNRYSFKLFWPEIWPKTLPFGFLNRVFL